MAKYKIAHRRGFEEYLSLLDLTSVGSNVMTKPSLKRPNVNIAPSKLGHMSYAKNTTESFLFHRAFRVQGVRGFEAWILVPRGSLDLKFGPI